MQLSTTNNPVERIGDTGEETQFSITTNAQAFEILSAGIYTDPILAVVRELSCNAYDAQVEAGKGDEPFIICLPNKMSPTFSVIDNGIGLSDEDLRGIYTSYFTSTKTNTNKQIGAFGLGSKSPFSYAKAFEVISRFGGEKRTYSIFLNEDGVPTMSEMANVPTDECNGIEINIAIRSEDHHVFADRAREVLQYFTVRPTIKGHPSFTWPEPSETVIIADTYTVDRNGSGLVAIQGNVPYHVNTYQVQDNMSDSCRRFMDRHRITLRFDIGMLDVAVSREEVRYEDRTKQNIADAMQLAFDDYLEQMDIQLSELTKTGSKWDIYALLRNTFGSRSGLEQLVGHQFKFKSNIANDWMESDSINFDIKWKYHTITSYTKGNIRAKRQQMSGNRQLSPPMYTIVPMLRTSVILQDVSKRSSLRINTKLVNVFAAGHICRTAVSIVPITDRMLAKSGLTATAAERKAELKKIVKQMGNPTVELLSEWTEDVLPEQRGSRDGGHIFKTLVDYSRTGSKPRFEPASEPTDGGIYLVIDHLRNIVINGISVNITARDLHYMIRPALNVINIANGTSYTLRDVFGLTKKVANYVSTDDNWIRVDVAYEEAIQPQKDIVEYYRRLGKSTTLSLHEDITKDGFIGVITDLHATSHFKQLMEPVILLSAKASDIASRIEFPVSKSDFVHELEAFNRHFNITIEVDDTSFYTADDVSDYPMLRHISFGYDSEARDALQYIQLVESK